MNKDLICALEERTFNAWPTLALLHIDGWIARFAEGVTGRANSLNALRPGPTPLGAILDTVAPLYAARGLPCRVRLTPLCPPHAERELEQRGFTLVEPSEAQLAELDGRLAIDPAVILRPEADEAWRAAYHAANPRFSLAGMAVVARIHQAIVPSAIFATLVADGEVQALGFAVADRDVVSLNEIATMPSARGRGLGRRLVASLLAWGRGLGASRGFLQVAADNAPALALYRTLGFRRLYDYVYALDRPAETAKPVP